MQRLTLSKSAVIVAMLSVAMMAWVVNSSGQAVRPVPGPGSGIVTVEGTVNVGNAPTVHAVQSGAWNVTVTTVTNPDFLQLKRRYSVTWADRTTETVTVVQLGSNGWVRVESPRRRWINLGQALSVEES